MILTNDQIRSIAFGTVAIREEERGLRFMKCTDAQIEESLLRSPMHGNLSGSASGARLDFYTDSTYLSFDASGDSRYEVMLDNLFFGQYDLKGYHERGERVEITLPEGEKRVTFIFPNFGSGAWLKYFELSDGAYFRPHVYDRKIYFYGDSITQGYNGKYNFTSFTHALSRKYNADILVNGVGGWFLNPKYVDKVPFEPDTVIIACGTNDWNRFKTPEDMRENTRGCMDNLKALFPNAQFFVLSPLWRKDTEEPVRPMGPFSLACDIVKEEAVAHGFNLLDGYTLVPHDPDFFGDARLHPNDIGFMVYTERICAVLDKYMK